MFLWKQFNRVPFCSDSKQLRSSSFSQYFFYFYVTWVHLVVVSCRFRLSRFCRLFRFCFPNERRERRKEKTRVKISKYYLLFVRYTIYIFFCMTSFPRSNRIYSSAQNKCARFPFYGFLHRHSQQTLPLTDIL